MRHLDSPSVYRPGAWSASGGSSTTGSWATSARSGSTTSTTPTRTTIARHGGGRELPGLRPRHPARGLQPRLPAVPVAAGPARPRGIDETAALTGPAARPVDQRIDLGRHPLAAHLARPSGRPSGPLPAGALPRLPVGRHRRHGLETMPELADRIADEMDGRRWRSPTGGAGSRRASSWGGGSTTSPPSTTCRRQIAAARHLAGRLRHRRCACRLRRPPTSGSGRGHRRLARRLRRLGRHPAACWSTAARSGSSPTRRSRRPSTPVTRVTGIRAVACVGRYAPAAAGGPRQRGRGRPLLRRPGRCRRPRLGRARFINGAGRPPPRPHRAVAVLRLARPPAPRSPPLARGVGWALFWPIIFQSRTLARLSAESMSATERATSEKAVASSQPGA